MANGTAGTRVGSLGRRTLALVLIGLALTSLVFLNWDEVKTFLKGVCGTLIPGQFCQSESAREVIGGYIFSVLALPLALLLEALIPARKDQPLYSVGLRQDVVWWCMNGILRVTLIAGFSSLLYMFYDGLLSFARIDAITQLPVVPQILLVILVSDFFGWFNHLVRHKVPLFWHFHAVHHSQREMNYFSDSRIHPVDSMTARLIVFIPFYSLEFDLAVPTFVAWEIFSSWFTRVYHSNIRTNFGPFKYITVTPQSHRIHHSDEVPHQDKNFGVIFSIWDFMFGTQYRDFDEYPETGIRDRDFPMERNDGPLAIVKNTIRQIVYPFISAWKSRTSQGPA